MSDQSLTPLCCMSVLIETPDNQTLARTLVALVPSPNLTSIDKYDINPFVFFLSHISFLEGTSKIQILAQECTKWLENEFVEDEPVKFCINEMW